MMMIDDGMFMFYVGLVTGGILLIVWVIVLIAQCSFLGLHEPAWIRYTRRLSLALVGIGLYLNVRWHIEHNRGAWLPEYFITAGVDLYLLLAIISTYARLRQIGHKL